MRSQAVVFSTLKSGSTELRCRVFRSDGSVFVWVFVETWAVELAEGDSNCWLAFFFFLISAAISTLCAAWILLVLNIVKWWTENSPLPFCRWRNALTAPGFVLNFLLYSPLYVSFSVNDAFTDVNFTYAIGSNAPPYQDRAWLLNFKLVTIYSNNIKSSGW